MEIIPNTFNAGVKGSLECMFYLFIKTSPYTLHFHGPLLWAKKIILNSNIDLLGLSIPTPFPGSELYKIAESRNIINKVILDKYANKELGEGYVGNYPICSSKNIDPEELLAIMEYINRKFYLNFKTLLKYFKTDCLSFNKIKRDLKDLFFLIKNGISSRKPYSTLKKN